MTSIIHLRNHYMSSLKINLYYVLVSMTVLHVTIRVSVYALYLIKHNSTSLLVQGRGVVTLLVFRLKLNYHLLVITC